MILQKIDWCQNRGPEQAWKDWFLLGSNLTDAGWDGYRCREVVGFCGGKSKEFPLAGSIFFAESEGFGGWKTEESEEHLKQ